MIAWQARAATQLLCAAALLCAAPAWALHWPWHHTPKAVAPASLRVVDVAMDSGAASAVTQSWDRNTLLLDLTHLSSDGAATLTPIAAAGGWPVRMEFRVRPGTFARLEVQGTQRAVFFVPSQGSAVTFQLDPGIYGADTPRVRLQWSAAGDLAR